jgi:hypothetical protein
LKVSFNPRNPNFYEKKLPIYIENDADFHKGQPVMDLVLRGTSARPKLIFDRRELLLPVVPLNIESRAWFKVINDGYENLKFKHRILEGLGNVEITPYFPEGNSIGLGKNKIKVEVAFKSSKPISFNTKIEISDDKGNSYILPIGGTADNCLFTNF